MSHQYPRAPFTKTGRITTGYSASHRGKDVVKRNDDTDDVLAMESGTVTGALSGQTPGDDAPNTVVIRGSDGYLTAYGHVDPSVWEGITVAGGDKIGVMDLSGQSSGKHVHISRLPAGESEDNGSVDDVNNRWETEAVNFTIKGLG
jgi:murein DD-endopeptidase MepM/ murein hydrolase activator NlpD